MESVCPTNEGHDHFLMLIKGTGSFHAMLRGIPPRERDTEEGKRRVEQKAVGWRERVIYCQAPFLGNHSGGTKNRDALLAGKNLYGC